MPGHIPIDLAFILFLPAFCLVGTLYWLYPRAPRGNMRRIADLAVLALAVIASIGAMRWGFRSANGVGGNVWKQVLATLLAYGCFLTVLGTGALLRSFWLRRCRDIG